MTWKVAVSSVKKVLLKDINRRFQKLSDPNSQNYDPIYALLDLGTSGRPAKSTHGEESETEIAQTAIQKVMTWTSRQAGVQCISEIAW